MRICSATVAGLLGGAALLLASSAYAGDPMENTFANTIVVTDVSTGATSEMLFNKDNTYTAEAVGKDGKPVQFAGTWTLKDDGSTICMTSNAPPGGPAPEASCSPLKHHDIGDSWKTTDDHNKTFDVALKAGR